MLCSEVSIDLNAIARNYEYIRNKINATTEVACVVKADSYGLGAKFIAPKLYDSGCRKFWVSHLTEAINLRQVIASDAEIFVLQGFTADDVDILKKLKITQVVNTTREFNLIKNHGLPIVLFVETGLTRLGIKESELDGLLESLANENIVYVMSHLGCASNPGHPQNRIQKENFDRILSKIRTYKPEVKATLSASQGALVENYYYDMVRIGAALYGNGIYGNFIPENVVTFRAPVIQKYSIPANTCVGYDATFISKQEMKIALLSGGYADGVPLGLGNRGYVYFKNYAAPVIGKVAMDLTTCDVTNVPDELTNCGCYAEILGSQSTLVGISKITGETASHILTGLNLHSTRVNVKYIR